MWTQSVLLLGKILDMPLSAASIFTAELRRLVVLASYVLLSSSSSPSIRTWDQLHGQILAGKSAHCKVK